MRGRARKGEVCLANYFFIGSGNVKFSISCENLSPEYNNNLKALQECQPPPGVHFCKFKIFVSSSFFSFFGET